MFDLVVVWPDCIDYPIFRNFITENRSKFNKVIVVFSPTNWGFTDMRPFIKEHLKDATFIDSDPVKDDWRDAAVKTALRYSDSPWVWFTEQDFLPQGDFWQAVDKMMESTEVFGYFQEERLHPCCTFVKRDLLNRLELDFGANPPKWDHFGSIQKQLDDKKIPIGVISWYYGSHLNGLSHNIHLLMNGEEPNYMVDEFQRYCRSCLNTGEIHPEFRELLEGYLGKWGYVN